MPLLLKSVTCKIINPKQLPSPSSSEGSGAPPPPPSSMWSLNMFFFLTMSKWETMPSKTAPLTIHDNLSSALWTLIMAPDSQRPRFQADLFNCAFPPQSTRVFRYILSDSNDSTEGWPPAARPAAQSLATLFISGLNEESYSVSELSRVALMLPQQGKVTRNHSLVSIFDCHKRTSLCVALRPCVSA